MSEKVLVITAGEYSDYHIIGAVRDRAIAEVYAKHLHGAVEEIEYLEDIEPRTKKGIFPWHIYMDKDGNIPREDWHLGPDEFDKDIKYPSFSLYRDNHSGKIEMVAHILAKDRDHAIKVAGELRTQILALNPHAFDKPDD